MSSNDRDPTPRLLLGPGPSMVHPRVMRAMMTPVVGHLDPGFTSVMDDVQSLLKGVFQAPDDSFAIAISGTGSAGMEAAVANFIEPGDRVLVGVHGYFGGRIAEMATRYGGDVQCLEVSWGEAISPAQVEDALKTAPARLVAIVHGETSTGVEQPIAEIAEVVHQHGGLLLVDTVASLGGAPFSMADFDVDICYSGSQKCLSAPPGLAPLVVNWRALDRLQSRKSPVTSWYLDLTLLQKYWGPERAYHHTAPVSLNYALREALRMLIEEGLQNAIARHTANARLLWDGLVDLDMSPFVPEDRRLSSLTTVRLPNSLDEMAVRTRLRDEYDIEIAGGLGTLKGKVWRVGLMGYSSQRANVVTLLGALEQILRES